MNRKKKIALIVIVVVSSALAGFVLFQVWNPMISIKATGTYLELSGSPHIKVTATNPTGNTLYDCFVNVKYLSANGNTLKFYLHIGTLEPHQESIRITEVNDLNPNITNVKDGIICDGYGYLKPLPSGEHVL